MSGLLTVLRRDGETWLRDYLTDDLDKAIARYEHHRDRLLKGEASGEVKLVSPSGKQLARAEASWFQRRGQGAR